MAEVELSKPIRKLGAIPTNNVVYMGKRVPARIDPEARVGQVVEVMSQVFGTKEHPITLCLRDESDSLVTQSNLPSKVIHSVKLKLCPSPASEALFVVHSLKQATLRGSVSGFMGDMTLRSRISTTSTMPDLPLKLALFNLQKYIKEEDFAAEFLLKGGMRALVHLLERSEGGLSGNALAYALLGLRGLLEYETAWLDMTDVLVDRILHVVVSTAQANIVRPATAVLRRLIEDPAVSSGISPKHMSAAMLSIDPAMWASSKGKAREPLEDDIRTLGFEALWRRILAMNEDRSDAEAARRLLSVLVSRLEGQGDLELVSQSLGLINALLKSAYIEQSPVYIILAQTADRLRLRDFVTRLMLNNANDLLEPQILAFQAQHATMLHANRLRHVNLSDPHQARMLRDILQTLRRADDAHDYSTNGHGDPSEWDETGWQVLGASIDEAGNERDMDQALLFAGVGELGLCCLLHATTHSDSIRDILHERLGHDASQQFPFGQASAECVSLLCDHYRMSTALDHPPSSYQPFLLDFPRLHSLVLRFFLRMWQESQALTTDFHRVASLVRSHMRVALLHEATRDWDVLERDLLQTEYPQIRDAQMDTLEREEGLMQRSAIRRLRDKISVEAAYVVIQQRVGCMLRGSWFNAATVITPDIKVSHPARPDAAFRFVRLSTDRKTLAWADFPARTDVAPPFERLRDRIDIANITSVRTSTGCAVNSLSPTLPSKLSISLMSGQELSLLDVDAIHAAQLAEWADGLRHLIGIGGLASDEGKGYAHILTELAVKIRLLDITGDGVDVPEKIKLGPDFWFAK